MSAHEPALCALPACPECDAYGLESALAVSVRPAVLDADGHTRDCAGPGCGATCGCPCHVGERP